MIKESNVEQVVGDFMKMDLMDVGQHDITFFLGVLYHLHDPFGSLKRLAMVTRELAIIETASIYLPNHDDVALMEFYEKDELGGDVNNWFAPNLTALVKMIRAAGFREVKIGCPYPPPIAQDEKITRNRLTVHAYK
jgi:hypothetical protein